MVHKFREEESVKKPRGRPFKKGNNRGKIRDEILDDSRSQISSERRIINSIQVSEESPTPCNKNEINLSEIIRSINESNEKEKSNQVITEEKSIETVDNLDFFNENNKLSIRLSKRHNRMYRVQIFLNDSEEIRPMTYTGSNTAMSFWNLLKGALKK